MATISNWVTLNEIVNTVKLRMGNLPENSHYRIMSVITSVLQEFNLHYRKTKKSAILNPNGKQFVELPEDFVDYLKIGYITPNGEILTLTKNDRLIDMLSIVCGNEDLITNENEATITDPASTLVEEVDVPAVVIITSGSLSSPTTIRFESFNLNYEGIIVWYLDDDIIDIAGGKYIDIEFIESGTHEIYASDGVKETSKLTFEIL